MPTVSEIELATFEDMPEITNLLESVNVPTDGINPDFTNFYIVRDENNKIVGCIGLELFTGTALLRSFAVNPDFQGNNIGRTLIRRLLDDANKAGMMAVYVCTAKAPVLFINNGFANVDLDDVPYEIRNSGLFKHGCPSGAAYMMRKTA
jgi:N-acetylglutamate synthase-like GNAT family acetyltransferase